MARTPALFATEAEFAILDEIWKHKERTVRQLVDVLYPAGTPSDLATVQKLLKRLEDKNLVNRNRGVSPQIVAPAIGRKELAKKELQAICDKYGMTVNEISKA